MSQPAKVSPLKLSGRPGVLVRTPFSKFFNGQLKTMVPRRDRWFNEHRGGWWIAGEFAEVAIHLVRESFGAVIVVDDEGQETIHEHGEKIQQGRLL